MKIKLGHIAGAVQEKPANSLQLIVFRWNHNKASQRIAYELPGIRLIRANFFTLDPR